MRLQKHAPVFGEHLEVGKGLILRIGHIEIFAAHLDDARVDLDGVDARFRTV